jgi:hypothetical protein
MTGMILSGVMLCATAAAQSARGELTVTVVVQASATLVNTNGQWTLVMANAADPADNLSSLIPVASNRFPAKPAAAIQGRQSNQRETSGHPTSKGAVRTTSHHSD